MQINNGGPLYVSVIRMFIVGKKRKLSVLCRFLQPEISVCIYIIDAYISPNSQLIIKYSVISI